MGSGVGGGGWVGICVLFEEILIQNNFIRCIYDELHECIVLL